MIDTTGCSPLLRVHTVRYAFFGYSLFGINDINFTLNEYEDDRYDWLFSIIKGSHGALWFCVLFCVTITRGKKHGKQ